MDDVLSEPIPATDFVSEPVVELSFQLLRHEASFVAIDKPPGFHVHQPEYPRRRVPREITCLPILRNQINKWVYPVHRLDVGTEGVLVFALSKESASSLGKQFQAGEVKKSYFALVRGYTDDSGCIDIPLELDSTGDPAESITHYVTHGRIELPQAVGKRHGSARYSLVEAFPETGRYHQVRRHFARLAHPLVGDRMHGDSHHNRYFREQLNLPGLWLKAKTIEFRHPFPPEGGPQDVRIESPWGTRWENLLNTLGFPLPTAHYLTGAQV